MEIHFHLRSLAAAGSYRLNRAGFSDTKAAQDEVAFENSRALTTALHNTPESRQDVVERAVELVGDVNYPPPETIRMISNLLAIQLQPLDEHGSPEQS